MLSATVTVSMVALIGPLKYNVPPLIAELPNEYSVRLDKRTDGCPIVAVVLAGPVLLVLVVFCWYIMKFGRTALLLEV